MTGSQVRVLFAAPAHFQIKRLRPGTEDFPFHEFSRMPDDFARLHLKHELARRRSDGRALDALFVSHATSDLGPKYVTEA
jgi:hypothetical protein